MTTKPLPRPYNHAEAFCLMKYASDDGSVSEILWNSRDGVTPFSIISKNGRKRMEHVDWNDDECVPDFKPPSGMRVFIDATLELVTPKLNEYVDRIWDDVNWPASKVYANKQACFDSLLPDWLGDEKKGAAPWIAVTP